MKTGVSNLLFLQVEVIGFNHEVLGLAENLAWDPEFAAKYFELRPRCFAAKARPTPHDLMTV